jgi:hypothetical protein
LHEVVLKEKEEAEKSPLAREGAETQTHTSRNKSVSTAEVLSLPASFGKLRHNTSLSVNKIKQ